VIGLREEGKSKDVSRTLMVSNSVEQSGLVNTHDHCPSPALRYVMADVIETFYGPRIVLCDVIDGQMDEGK